MAGWLETRPERGFRTVFIVSYLVVLAATPLAIRVARSTGFLDRPRGYRTRANPTPCLGGAAVLMGFLAAAPAGGVIGDARYAALFAGAGLLWLPGTINDWAGLGVLIRCSPRQRSPYCSGRAAWAGRSSRARL